VEAPYHEAAAAIGPLPPEEIGDLYERLRGFKLGISHSGKPTLVPSVRGKRNQGLFYTPPQIVRHIVDRTLDALDISDPADYLDLKILDPAVGTGRFLLEALTQITDRVCLALGNCPDGLCQKIDGLKERLRLRALDNGVDLQPDDSSAISIHVIENCLFGVDIDPIAVSIARAALASRVPPVLCGIPSDIPNLRVGNALMGAGKPEASPEDPGQWHSFDGDHDIRLFHWPLEYPQVFRKQGGFDAVVGNPPYEILSVKESGISQRAREQDYFRRVYKTCHGKVNTYRLMLERGLDLLGRRGALGFIVPATLLADTSAEKLRRLILDGFAIRHALVIPEKAQVFEGVTQALLILVAKEGRSTHSVKPIVWDGSGAIPESGVEISKELIRRTGYRIPVLRDETDKRLLECLSHHPPLGGDEEHAPAATVHQGEINLTVHRRFITSQRTGSLLIRGEHVTPLRVVHPSPNRERLDWVMPAFFEHRAANRLSKREARKSAGNTSDKVRGTPWEQSRIVLGRVVNMGTDRRLKAGLAPKGAFLGDMTNFIARPSLSMPYLLGLLNSRLLNSRIKLTSTNNYLSAAEVEALPVPRPAGPSINAAVLRIAQNQLATLAGGPDLSVAGCMRTLAAGDLFKAYGLAVIPSVIEWVVGELQSSLSNDPSGTCANLWNILDALVLLLYGVEFYAPVLDG
jgi:hypothetical protein